MPIILCTNRTREVIDCQGLIKAARIHLRKQPKMAILEISIVIVGIKRMRSLNKKFRHLDRPTDILTFIHQTPIGLVGEIYLQPDYAHLKGHSLNELVIHGLWHCQGVHHR